MNRDFLSKEFSMTMDPRPADVQGRVLPAPVLGVGGKDNRLVPRDGSWDMRNKQFYTTVDINCWAIVLFINDNLCRAESVRNFAGTFKTVASREGIRVTSDPVAVKYERPHKVRLKLCGNQNVSVYVFVVTILLYILPIYSILLTISKIAPPPSLVRNIN